MPPVKPCREFGHLTRTTRAGIRALAMQIKVGRKKRRWTQEGLANRVGCSRLTIMAIENAKPTVAIGYVLEAAHMVGLDVFGSPDGAKKRLESAREIDAIFPSRIETYVMEIDDDF
ncbi:XRE family transcriptional regulator [Acetobacter pasteurianus NBRC 3280]|uniref:XRE family transcriptional regulator n=1 Tax=Acetobacter pasteurianus NBRC 3278 TaxID=1226660 RepID=A0A401X7V7_ACEPA|nr:transcriptional regulator [Acetobacter pasteurianus]GCD59998.1 XRE family transcriptional regulator [Acetobacter pasteurianus NBRC 3277]GCD63749.1 XRE family transcriptional regulator [Acetobacter pasteurianus NBRC 3278]GCD69907.1 XRE family transcriptional regulator [Acetobacter pasteurianus NBRC 3280]